MITERTVEVLVRQQFPDLAHLPVRRVALDGWDNRSFRVGEELVARLPSAAGYVAQVGKEIEWLPWLRARLPIPVPEILGVGEPSDQFPSPWTIRRWIPGEPYSASSERPVELGAFLSGFLRELWSLDPVGPTPGPHSAFRGAAVTRWADEVVAAIKALPSAAERRQAEAVWAEAVAATADESSTLWLHGDIAPGNLLVHEGKVGAVIDFGCAAVGDPACDLAICWTDLDAPSRHRLREDLDVPDALWARGRGWALWKALITVRDPVRGATAAATLAALRVFD
ncbi:MAG TPA: aminoglycoside phosphotransferase family protein [Naasia sp.]